MTDTKPAGRLMRQSEAQVHFEAISDKKTRDLVGTLLATIWEEKNAGVVPVMDFDLEYLAKIFIKFASKHELLESILTDGDLGSWPD